jgi:hypothetical protein
MSTACTTTRARKLRLRRTLQRRVQQLGELHPSTLTSMRTLGSLLKAQGKLEEAQLLFHMELGGCLEVYGKDHEQTMASASCLMNLLESSAESAHAMGHGGGRAQEAVLPVQRRSRRQAPRQARALQCATHPSSSAHTHGVWPVSEVSTDWYS